MAITLTPGSVTVPSTASGFHVNNVSNIVMTTNVANGTVTSATASGGSVSGTVSSTSSTVKLTVPGPISGGTTYTPPAENVSVTAGASGKTLTTEYAGTSYANPGMTLTVNVQTPFGPANVATACYPNPNAVLTSTTIS